MFSPSAYRWVLRFFCNGSFPKPTMASADFSKAFASETSPGKSIFLPPIPAWSTISVFNPCGMFWTSQWCACLSILIASYQVPVRQYRGLPVGFLHCLGHPKPACHLLMLQGVTPAHKGLTPSGIISCCTYVYLFRKFVFYNLFQSFYKSVHMLMLGTHTRYKKLPEQ